MNYLHLALAILAAWLLLSPMVIRFLVSEARDQGYRDGYKAGQRDAESEPYIEATRQFTLDLSRRVQEEMKKLEILNNGE